MTAQGPAAGPEARYTLSKNLTSGVGTAVYNAPPAAVLDGLAGLAAFLHS